MKKCILVIMSLIIVMQLIACGTDTKDANAEQYNEYVEAYLDALYLGNTEKYMEIAKIDAETAQLFYEQSWKALAEDLKEYFGLEVLLEEDVQTLYNAAKSLYAKLVFNVQEAVQTENTYSVKVQISPLDFYQSIDEAYANYVDEINQKVKDGYFDSYSDKQYESEYTKGLLAIIEQYVANTSTTTPVNQTLRFFYDESNGKYYLSDEDLETLSSKLLVEVEVQ